MSINFHILLFSNHLTLLNITLFFLQNSPLFQYLHDLGHTDFEACQTASQEEEYINREGDLPTPDDNLQKTLVSFQSTESWSSPKRERVSGLKTETWDQRGWDKMLIKAQLIKFPVFNK